MFQNSEKSKFRILNSKFYQWFSVSLLFCLVLFSMLPLATKAETSRTANLYFLPRSGIFEVGDTFSVRVAVNTGGQAINAVEDIISFSKDTLEATGVSKKGTIITFWITEPTYNNSIGQATFSGGIPNPGFSGIGRLFIINFKAKAAGKAWVKFTMAKVLANDGLGTNIFVSNRRSDFTIKKRALPTPVKSKPAIISPVIPKISSPTHSNQNKWYAKREVVLNWACQRGIIDFSYVLNKKPETNPDNIGEGLDTSISYLDVADGIWYFHLKAKTRKGWGESAHYKIQIDTVPPTKFKIISAETLPTSNPSPVFRFEAEDETSGINFIQAQIDDGESIRLDKLEYHIPLLAPCRHKLWARVYDKAGNFVENSLEFKILPLSVPKITYWTKKILFGEPFVIAGWATPETKINLTIIDKEGKPIVVTTKSDDKGAWRVEYKEILKRGKYKFYATQETPAGIVSPSSKEKVVEILTNAVKIFGVILPVIVLKWLIVFFITVIAILVVIILAILRKFKKCDIALHKFIIHVSRRGRNIKVEEK